MPQENYGMISASDIGFNNDPKGDTLLLSPSCQQKFGGFRPNFGLRVSHKAVKS